MTSGTILIRADIDRFRHNTLFADELVSAFADYDLQVEVLDYLQQSKKVLDRFQDPACKFFLTFNGFGTELRRITDHPGRLDSAFQAFGKPVFDLMHDCPAHETMSHQVSSTFAMRRLLSTDWQYASIANDMGVRDVSFSSSITFPRWLSQSGVGEKRDIGVLLAIGTSDPEPSRARITLDSPKGRLFRSVFDEVVAISVADWRKEPLVELKLALQALEWSFDPRQAEHRFLLSAILDYVKFARRRDMLGALVGLPVTLVPDQKGDYPDSFSIEQARTAAELLDLMRRSRVVICPTTHPTGHHERPLSAFTASAAVLSTPNRMLAASFRDGESIMFATAPEALRAVTEKLMNDDGLSEAIGRRGHDRAMQLYHPRHLVETILNRLSDS